MISERKKIEFSLLFQPSGKQIKVTRDETILQGEEKAGVPFEAECGGNGRCGKCKVKIIEPAPDIRHIGHTSDINETEKELLTDDEIKNGIRLACQTKLTGDVVVQNLCETKTSTAKIDIKGIERKIKLDSGTKKTLVKPKTPQLGEKASYLEKLTGKRFARGQHASLQALQSLARNITKATSEMTVVTFRDEIIDIEAGNTKSQNYGLAVDIGTTTLACYLINLNNGEQVTALAKTNSQAIYGSDVLSRVCYSSKTGGLRELHRRIKADINDMVKEVCDKGMIQHDNIYKMVLVGNPCMEHLFWEISPVSLGRKPYASVMRRAVHTKAQQLGIKINKEGIVFYLPLVSGFIGADAVAMTLACRMDESDDNRLAIDIGTNTEIVLSTKRKLMACSAAAGPAFEGAHIKYGMRATDGAIDKVNNLDNEINVNVIGDAPAKGICGSGLIDTVAELLRIGIIDQKGRILGREKLPLQISPNLRERVSSTEEGNQFEIVKPDESYDGKPIYLTQKDVRELQLAQGAIAAGIRFLLKESGISVREVSAIFLAGAFGNFVSIKNAIRIGLIPQVPLNKVRFVGNAAGEGAKLALLSERLMKKAERISEKVRYVELSDRKEFLDLFVESMVFPDIKA